MHAFGSSRGVTRVAAAGFALAAAVIGALAWQSMQLNSATCEVCMHYNGREKCRTVSASNIEEARMGAIVNACAFISGGVTDSMACQRATPLREECR